MKRVKTIAVIFGAVIITALGIDAADTITGSKGMLLSQVIRTEEGVCPSGMNQVFNIVTLTCVDTYEVSPGEKCPISTPANIIDSHNNIESTICVPESKADALPWRFITRDQAMQACARVGKRLPTNEEWYQLTLGTVGVEDACNVRSGSVAKTGEYDSCVSPHGAFDQVGNVWEWVSDDVINGMYRERILPKDGYVAQTDGSGMATVSSEQPQTLFGNDYFWSEESGAYGIIRGGYYDSDSDAGIYSVHADTLPTAAGVGIGFRCVR